MKRFTKALMTTGMVLAAVGFMTDTAVYATDGYFAHGTGARQKALGGAGVADSTDATAAALNPAGLVHSPDQLNISASVFSPSRSADRFSNPAFSPGTQTSDGSLFVIPNIAWSKRLDGSTVVGLTAYGNGGMNTEYSGVGNQAEIGFGGKNPNVLFSNIEQLLLSATYAKQFGSFALGVAPIFAVQSFELQGLQGYDSAFWSTNPGSVTNRGKDWTFGGGVKAGFEWEAMSGFRIGVAGTSPIYMTKNDRYSGTLAGQGSFNIPATIQAGFAADITPALTVMVDYKRIFYSGIDSISNHGPYESTADAGIPALDRRLGSDNGIGFGWEDLNIIKVGVEWDVDSALTLRFGYSYNDNPLNSDDLVFNAIAPATIEQHITAGMKIAATDNVDIEIAGMFAPRKTVTGVDHGPGGDANDCAAIGGANACGNYGDDRVSLSMEQWELTMGVVWKLGQPEASLK